MFRRLALHLPLLQVVIVPAVTSSGPGNYRYPARFGIESPPLPNTIVPATANVKVAGDAWHNLRPSHQDPGHYLQRQESLEYETDDYHWGEAAAATDQDVDIYNDESDIPPGSRSVSMASRLSSDKAGDALPSSPPDSFFADLNVDSGVPRILFSDASTYDDLQDLVNIAGKTTPLGNLDHPSGYVSKEDWRRELVAEALVKIHHRIESHWPTNIDSDTARKWHRYLHRHLENRIDLVQHLLKNDSRAWQYIIRWCDPLAMTKRSRSYARHTSICRDSGKKFTPSMNVNWMAGTISSSEREAIITRLSERWHGMLEQAVTKRLCTYAGFFGKIQSPEPLLSSDEILFAKAADIIYATSDRRRKDCIHPEAGFDDILHQRSEEYSVFNTDGTLAFIPIEQKLRNRKPTAKRYHTNHSWLDTVDREQIDFIHGAIDAHWVDQVTMPRRAKYLAQANEHLEEDKSLVKRILSGDDVAAWNVAKMVVEHTWFMKSAKVYAPSGYFDQVSLPQTHNFE